MCSECEEHYDLSGSAPNKFLTIDVAYQLQSLLNDPIIQNDLMENIEKRHCEKNDDVISDVYDAPLWKRAQQENPGTLTFNINLDGGSVFHASTLSALPAQLHLNELSPNIRFKNVILAGVHITHAEPKPDFMNLYISAVLNQMRSLKEDGINITLHSTGETRNSKLTCLLLPVDTIARPIIQNRVQFNGYSGCSWCYDNGVWTNNCVRYLLTPESTLRTHDSHIQDVKDGEKAGRFIRGVKGPSILQEEEHIDLL